MSINNNETQMGKSPSEKYRETKMSIELESLRQDKEMRKRFSFRIFWFVVIYVALVVLLVYLISSGCFSCSDTIVVTLLSTTTANTFG